MKQEFKYFSNRKLVKSGSLLEVYTFGRDINLGRRIRHLKTDEQIANAIKYPKLKASAEEILKSSARRAKRIIKRLILANCFLWFKAKGQPYLPITLTLTFKENIVNLKQANYEVTKFIRRLNYETNGIEGKDLKQSNLKYLAVFELQKRGAIHYHMIFFNLPYIKNIYKKLFDIWGQGRIMVGGKDRNFTKVKNQAQLQKIIFYFIKYIQKSIFENDCPRQKKYITSKGLLKPQENSFVEIVSLVESKLPLKSLVYSWDGETEYMNSAVGQSENFLRWFNYWQYNLSDYPELDKNIDSLLKNRLAGDSLGDIDF